MRRLYEEGMGIHVSTGHGSSKDDYKFNPRITQILCLRLLPTKT